MFFPKIYHLPEDTMSEIAAAWLDPSTVYKLVIAIMTDKKTSPIVTLFALLRAFNMQQSKIGIKCQEILPMALHITLPGASTLLVRDKKLLPAIDEVFSESMKSEQSSPGHRLQVLNFISVLEKGTLLWDENHIGMAIRQMMLGDNALQKMLTHFVAYVCFFYLRSGERIFINQVCTILNSDPKNVTHYDNALKALNLMLPFMKNKNKESYAHLLETFFDLAQGNFKNDLLKAAMSLDPKVLNEKFEEIFSQLHDMFSNKDYEEITVYIQTLSTHPLFQEKFLKSEFPHKILRVIHNTPSVWNFEVIKIIHALISFIKESLNISVFVKNIIWFLDYYDEHGDGYFFEIYDLFFHIITQLVRLFSKKEKLELFQTISAVTVTVFDDIKAFQNLADNAVSEISSDSEKIFVSEQATTDVSEQATTDVSEQVTTDLNEPDWPLTKYHTWRSGIFLFSTMIFALSIPTHDFTQSLLTLLNTELTETYDKPMRLLFCLKYPLVEKDISNENFMNMLDLINDIEKIDTTSDQTILKILTKLLPSMTKVFVKKVNLLRKILLLHNNIDGKNLTKIQPKVLALLHKLLPLLSHEQKRELFDFCFQLRAPDYDQEIKWNAIATQSLSGFDFSDILDEVYKKLAERQQTLPIAGGYDLESYQTCDAPLYSLKYLSQHTNFSAAKNYFNTHQLFHQLNSDRLKQFYANETEFYTGSSLADSRIHELLSCAKFYAIEHPEQLKQILDEGRSLNQPYLLFKLALSFSDPLFNADCTLDAFSTMIDECGFFDKLIGLLQSSNNTTAYDALKVTKTIASPEDSHLNTCMQAHNERFIPCLLDRLFDATTTPDICYITLDILSLRFVQGLDLNPYLASYSLPEESATNGWWLILCGLTGYNPATPAPRLG
ncbi:MAG: hypothetical protein V4496_05430 [Pseudomonadota bacterium]